jgi:hypothetical protein
MGVVHLRRCPANPIPDNLNSPVLSLSNGIRIYARTGTICPSEPSLSCSETPARETNWQWKLLPTTNRRFPDRSGGTSKALTVPVVDETRYRLPTRNWHLLRSLHSGREISPRRDRHVPHFSGSTMSSPVPLPVRFAPCSASLHLALPARNRSSRHRPRLLRRLSPAASRIRLTRRPPAPGSPVRGSG